MRVSVFVPTAVLGLGVLLVSGMREQYAMESKAPMNNVAMDIPGYTARNIVVAEEERRVAGMSDYMLRSYEVDSSALFTTYVGYYDRQVQGKSIHSPKNCLPGAGWEILNSAPVAAPSGRAGETMNRVMLANKGSRALVYYWYQGRGRIESNEYKVKWDLLRDAASYGRTEEALVRIVVPLSTPKDIAQGDSAVVQRADSVAMSVAARLIPAVDAVMPASPRS
jgi:EpsI family protein